LAVRETAKAPRAAATFTPEKHRAAAVTVLTLPGARLLHEGQLEGRRVRLPVFLARRPEESPDLELLAFYQQLLAASRRGEVLQGAWRLCERVGWEDNPSYMNLVSWCWQREEARCIIVVNLSDAPAQGRVRVPWDDLKGRSWRLQDAFTTEVYERDGDEIHDQGYVGVRPGVPFGMVV
jgi:hypothetical protein